MKRHLQLDISKNACSTTRVFVCGNLGRSVHAALNNLTSSILFQIPTQFESRHNGQLYWREGNNLGHCSFRMEKYGPGLVRPCWLEALEVQRWKRVPSVEPRQQHRNTTHQPEHQPARSSTHQPIIKLLIQARNNHNSIRPHTTLPAPRVECSVTALWLCVHQGAC
jgi:hypothetical protein